MKKFLSAMLAVVLLLGICGASMAADEWQPEHEIRYIVPYGPGGASDTIGRTAAKYLTEELGVPVVVENIPGAGCVIGWTELYSRPADGYTISMSSTVASPWITEVLSPTPPPWKGDDFIPAGSMTGIGGTGGFVCKRDRWTSFMSFIEEVKANPGKIKFGLQGPGGIYDSQFWEFEKLTGLDFNIVYYPDASQIQTDLLTGDLDVGRVNANSEDFVANENFTILAIWGKEVPEEYPVKLPMLADFSEQIGFKWEDTTYVQLDFTRQDLIVKEGTDPAIIARFEKALENVHANPNYTKDILVIGWPYFEKSASALESYQHLRDVLRQFLDSPDYAEWLEKVQ